MTENKSPLLTVFLGIGFKDRVLFQGALHWPSIKKEKPETAQQEIGFGDKATIVLVLAAVLASMALKRYFGWG